MNIALSDLKGVGRVTAEHLEAVGLVTALDLINYFPRRYDDYSKLLKIKFMQPGKISLKVKFSQIRGRQVRRGLSITEAVAQDDTGKVKVVWFNQPYRAKSIRIDKEYFLSGEYAFQSNRMQIVNPSIELADNLVTVHTGRIIPIYSEKGNVNSVLIRKLIKEVLPLINSIGESLPGWLIKKYGLMEQSQALANIHLPNSQEDLEKARERLGFDELFVLMMAANNIKSEALKAKALRIAFNQKAAKDFVAKLPFKLTDSQRKSVWQIYKDIDSEEPMNRLIEGDVGSGKTVVAAMASLMVAESGYQVAFLAPTELLAAPKPANRTGNESVLWNLSLFLLTAD